MNLPLSRMLAGVLLQHAAAFAALPSAPPPAPIVWHAGSEVASGAGEKGPWQQNDSRYDYVDDPTVLFDQRGGLLVAWVDQGRKDVLLRRLTTDGKPAGEAINVSRSPATFSWLPRLARAPDAPATVYLLWQEIIFSGGSHGGEMLLARSDDGGASFGPPLNLSASVGGDGKGRINPEVWHNGSYDLAAGPDGALYVAWTEYDGPLWFSRSGDGGKSFSKPRQLAGRDRPARAPSLALGTDGRLHLAWTSGDDPGANVRVASSEDGGASFGEARVVGAAAGYADAPRLAVTPDGALHLVYAQSSGGPFERYRIRHARAADGRRFDAPRDIVDPAALGVESVGFPMPRIDGAGRLHVLFELFPDHRQRPRGLGLTVSDDGGTRFARPVMVPRSADAKGVGNGSHQGLLMDKLAVGAQGQLAIVNSSLAPGRGSRIWLMRGMLGTQAAPGDVRNEAPRPRR